MARQVIVTDSSTSHRQGGQGTGQTGHCDRQQYQPQTGRTRDWPDRSRHISHPVYPEDTVSYGNFPHRRSSFRDRWSHYDRPSTAYYDY
ncbi:hypothetical protein ACOMHN_049398 [Nucella lapillus]